MKSASAPTSFKAAEQGVAGGNQILEYGALHNDSANGCGVNFTIDDRAISYLRSRREKCQVHQITIRCSDDRPIDKYVWHSVIRTIHPKSPSLKVRFKVAANAFVNAWRAG